MSEVSEVHEFNDGSTGIIARRDDETFPIITVTVSKRDEHTRNHLGRAGQKMLEPGERLVPMRMEAFGMSNVWFYTASQIADRAADQLRLERNRQRGSVGKPSVRAR